MTEQEYAEIAAACDRLLRAPGTSLGRVAIPLLHVLNEHPRCVAQYEPLLRSNGLARTRHFRFPFADSARAAVRAGRALARSFRWPVEPSMRARALARVDVLIVSRLANPSQLDTEDDFYFGALQSLLRERGVNSVLVLVDHLPNEDSRRVRAKRPFPPGRQLISRTVAANIEAQIWQQCVMAQRNLRQAAHHSLNPIDATVAMLASRHALFGNTATNLRLHASISDICRRLNPGIVITTHEGAASERIIWHAARSTGRWPLCVGYQHTRLFQRAHAIRRPVAAPGIDCDPDVILTLGEIPHAALAACPELDSVRLIAYGSHRRAEPAEFRPLCERPRLCLVLPDADANECAYLFEFALACARQAPAITFVLRPHPLVNFAILRSRHNALRELPENVTPSVDRTLEQECARARYFLYRGSSAALHAVLAGVKPFYLARAGELSFDPLFALCDWRETVAAPEDFSDRVRAADAAPDPSAASRAWSFYDRYVSQVRPAAIDELLTMIAQ